MGYLKIVEGADAGRVFPIGEEPTCIGREAADGIMVNDHAASRLHAEVFRVGDSYFFRDLNSKNGTLLNDHRLEEGVLREGDRITIGGTVLAFLREREPAAAAAGDAAVPFPGQTVEIALGRKDASRPLQGAARLSYLFDAARTISRARDRRALLPAVLDIALDATGADAGYVYLRDKESGRLVPAARREKQPGTKEKISRSIITGVLKNAKAVMTSDALTDQRFRASQSVIAKGIHSVICSPLVAMREISGVIYLAMSHRHRCFSAEDLEFVSTLAMQAGIALESIETLMRERQLFNGAIRALTRAVYLHEPASRGHMDRVAEYAEAVAEAMHLPAPERATIRFAAQIHDIGKLAIPDSERRQAGREVLVKEHVEKGVQIIEGLAEMAALVPGVRYHHEALDGSGPYGLTGDQIPVEAKIIATCNAFDNMTTHGGLAGQGLTVKEVLAELQAEAGKLHDPKVVAALADCAHSGRLFAEKENRS